MRADEDGDMGCGAISCGSSNSPYSLLKPRLHRVLRITLCEPESVGVGFEAYPLELEHFIPNLSLRPLISLDSISNCSRDLEFALD